MKSKTQKALHIHLTAIFNLGTYFRGKLSNLKKYEKRAKYVLTSFAIPKAEVCSKTDVKNVAYGKTFWKTVRPVFFK